MSRATKAQLAYRAERFKDAAAKRDDRENATRQEMLARFGRPLALVTDKSHTTPEIKQ